MSSTQQRAVNSLRTCYLVLRKQTSCINIMMTIFVSKILLIILQLTCVGTVGLVRQTSNVNTDFSKASVAEIAQRRQKENNFKYKRKGLKIKRRHGGKYSY